MKTNELKALLNSHSEIDGGIAHLLALQEKSKAKLGKLEAEADLENEADLDKIARFRVQADMLPQRLAGLGEIQASSQFLLLRSAEEFVEATIRPKIKALRALAVKKITPSLESIFTGEKLANAINESEVVASLDQIGRRLIRENEPASPIQYVTGRLAVLDQLAKIEKSLQS